MGRRSGCGQHFVGWDMSPSVGYGLLRRGNILATYQSETAYNGDWANWIEGLNYDIMYQVGERAFFEHIGEYYGQDSVFRNHMVSGMLAYDYFSAAPMLFWAYPDSFYLRKHSPKCIFSFC